MALFGPVLCVHSSKWVNWKINSNLNYWNKELQETQIKKETGGKKTSSSSRSPLIGKSFLQGIPMVLREDCKIKLMSWGEVNSARLCLCVFHWPGVFFFSLSHSVQSSPPSWQRSQMKTNPVGSHTLRHTLPHACGHSSHPSASWGSVGGSRVKLN